MMELACLILLSPTLMAMAQSECSDDDSFSDESGYPCSGWIGYDCTIAHERYRYSEQGEEDVLKHCKQTCAQCSQTTMVPMEAARPSPTTAVIAGQLQCLDDDTFLDESGYTCSEWTGFNCTIAHDQYDYSQQGENQVLEHCKQTCAQCQPFSPSSAKSTMAPCMIVNCLPGYHVVGADESGCGGSCLKECSDAKCTRDLCSDGKGRRQIKDECCACPTPETIAPCVIVDCLPGYHVVGADESGCGGSCLKECDDAKCIRDLCSDGKGRRQIGDECCACPAPATITPCVIVDCLPGYHVVGADDSGCGGSCQNDCEVCALDLCVDGKGRRQIGDECCACPEPATIAHCVIVDCLPGYHVVGADGDGCDGKCELDEPQCTGNLCSVFFWDGSKDCCKGTDCVFTFRPFFSTCIPSNARRLGDDMTTIV